MAEYAYREECRSTRVDPVEALGERGNVNHYYCPNPKCSAWLRVVREDDRHKNPFFRAMPSHAHIENCDYKAYYDSEAQKAKIQQTNKGLHIDDFNIGTLFERVTTALNDDDGNTIEPRKKDKTEYTRESLIGSTEKLARFCIAHEIGDNLGESPIIDFLIDSRTAYERYSKYINVENGDKVFLLLLPLSNLNYDKEKTRLFLSLQEEYRDKPAINYRFEIKCDSNELLRAFLNATFELKGTKSKVAILTKMKKYFGNDNHYICSIISNGQFWVRMDNSMA